MTGGPLPIPLLWCLPPTDNSAMELQPSKSPLPKITRRRFQFRLRTLFIFTLIVAIPCAWLGRKIEQKQRERHAVNAIRKLGSLVIYDYENDNQPPSGPAWLRKLLGNDFFSDAIAVEAFVGNIGDADLANVKELPHLRILEVEDCAVTDAGLANLKGLAELQSLNLRGTGVTDAGIIQIKQLTRLDVLALDNTKVTEKGVKELQAALPNCQIQH